MGALSSPLLLLLLLLGGQTIELRGQCSCASTQFVSYTHRIERTVLVRKHTISLATHTHICQDEEKQQHVGHSSEPDTSRRASRDFASQLSRLGHAQPQDVEQHLHLLHVRCNRNMCRGTGYPWMVHFPREEWGEQ